MTEQHPIKTLLENACTFLSSSDSARLDAELLLQSTLGCERSYLYSHADEHLSADQLTNYQTLLEQRQRGKPLAYLTGVREFWSLPLRVTGDTLIPRPETETLVEAALNLIPKDRAFHILDLGTGSGAIALALAHERPRSSVTATDRSAAALTIASDNAARLGLQNLRFINSHWYQQLHGQRYDMIVSNPPYIAESDPHLSDPNLQFEPRAALVSANDGLADLQHIIAHSHTYLNDNGYLMLEHGWQQGEAVAELLKQYCFNRIDAYHDLQDLHRVSLGAL